MKLKFPKATADKHITTETRYCLWQSLEGKLGSASVTRVVGNLYRLSVTKPESFVIFVKLQVTITQSHAMIYYCPGFLSSEEIAAIGEEFDQLELHWHMRLEGLLKPVLLQSRWHQRRSVDGDDN